MCQFKVYRKMIQLYICVYTYIFVRFLNIVPCAVQWIFIVYFMHN